MGILGLVSAQLHFFDQLAGAVQPGGRPHAQLPLVYFQAKQDVDGIHGIDAQILESAVNSHFFEGQFLGIDDHVADALARVTGPGAIADARGKFRHPIENFVNLRHYVFPFNKN